MKDLFIVAAKRTPIGSFGGIYKNTSAVDLGALSMENALETANLNPNLIDEVFFGNVISANLGQGPTRQSSLKAGIPNSVPCTTLNKLCASGMKSLIIGCQTMISGDNEAIMAGGMENMSRVPFYLENARFGYGYGNSTLIDGLYKDGLEDAYAHEAMGCFADATAKSEGITREEQDEYAINSYKRAAKAWEDGSFKNEVFSIELKDNKGNSNFIFEDEEFKKVYFDKIPNLKPVFSKDGTVTAANASTINDGAAAIIAVTKDFLEKHNLKAIAKIISYADAAREPEWFTTAPILAADKALKKANLKMENMDFLEVNEAFAVVPLAFMKHYKLSIEKVNVFGGAVSIGHPLGCSGARIICTLINVLHSKNGKYGMAAICNGGGGASAMILEKI